jgi:mono/diheme cytochrome c family protein
MKARSLLIAVALLCACGGQEQAPAPKPPAPPATPPATAPAPAPTPAPAPPPAAAKPDATRGQALYVANCASCHGPRGEGDGPAGAALTPKPAKHSDGAYMNGLSNQHLFKVIKEGGLAVGKSPLMAPWSGVLNDAQIWDVVAFVRSLAKPPYPGTVP